MIQACVTAALHAVIAGVVFGGLLVAVVAVVIRLVPLDAGLRCGLWTFALCALAIMPLATLGVSAVRATGVQASSAPADFPPSRVSPAMMLSAAARHVVPAASVRTTIGRLYRGVLPWWAPRPSRAAAFALAGTWVAGTSAGLIGLLLGLLRVDQLKRRSRPLDAQFAAELPWLTQNTQHEREIYLRLSDETETPMAVGFRRPIVLIPTELAMAGGLSAIEGLIVHEHAHLRRYDDWINLGQRCVERVFWFNPLIWLVGRRIALEREIAADDAVVAATGEPAAYASALWQMAREMRMPAHASVAPGALFTRRQISVRIEALLERRPVQARWRQAAALTVGLIAVGCTIAAAATAPRLLRSPADGVAQRASGQQYDTGIAASHDAVAASQLTSLAGALHTAASAVALSVERPAQAVAIGAEAGAGTSAGSDLRGQNLRGIDWRGRRLTTVDLQGADLRGARLDRAVLENVDLSGARLDGASLVDATFTNTNIEGASFHAAHTRGLRVAGSSLAGTDLRGLDVRALLGACGGCDLSGADLRNNDLHGINLASMNLSGADLRGADLHATVFTADDLEGADFVAANLRAAQFVGCDMQGAALDTTAAHDARFVASDR